MELNYQPIEVNEYSRPGRKLSKVLGIVLHWVGNANQTEDEVRSYFELRKYGNHGYGSAQFIIGLEGEILQIMPEDEVAYHCGAKEYTKYARAKYGRFASARSSPNNCTIGIELCHIGWDGFMPTDTLDSARCLCQMLIKRYNLSPLDITTHWNLSLKEDDNGPCPKWFVEHPEDFQHFVETVRGGDDGCIV